MLKVNGVEIPREVEATPREDADHDPIGDYARAHGGTAPAKGTPVTLPAPLARLRAKLEKRAADAKAAKEAREQRTKELADKNAPAKPGARAVAKTAATQDVVAPKSGNAPDAKAQG